MRVMDMLITVFVFTTCIAQYRAVVTVATLDTVSNFTALSNNEPYTDSRTKLIGDNVTSPSFHSTKALENVSVVQEQRTLFTSLMTGIKSASSTKPRMSSVLQERIFSTTEDSLNTHEMTSGTSISKSKLTIEMISSKKLLTYIPAIIFTSILMLIGIPGNAIAWYVYFKKWRRSSTRTFILALASLDFINSCLSLPFEISVMSLPLIFDSGIICKVIRYLTYMCNTSAALTLIAIAVDRYQRICKPLENAMTPKTSKIIVLIIMLVSVVMQSPSLILYGTQTIPIQIGSQLLIGKMCIIEDRFTQTKYPLIFFIFNCVATSLIFLILTVLYMFVGIQVCRRNRMRSLSRSTRSLSEVSIEDEDDKLYIGDNKQNQKPETEILNNTNVSVNSTLKKNTEVPPSPGAIKLVFMSAAGRFKRAQSTSAERRAIRMGKTTIMLIAVTIVYIISFLPFLGLSIHRSIYAGEWKFLSNSGQITYQLFSRTYLINCAVNPIVYSFCNELFRKECISVLKQIFSRRTY